MGSGTRHSTRALAVACALIALAVLGPSTAGAASQSADTAIARAGAFVDTDFPAGFQSTPATGTSHADNIRLAKGIDGCGPFVALQKSVAPLPQFKSARFADDTRSMGNEVDVFPNERAASATLTLYAKSSVVGCLENLFEKQTRLDPGLRDSLDDVVVNLDRQDIAGLGDDSVVYEGHVLLTGTDGSTKQVGIGSAAVRVGRAVDVVTYSTSGDALTDVLTPAIDASVARVRSALGAERIVIRRAGLTALVVTTVLGGALAATFGVAGGRPAGAASTTDAQLGRAGVFVASDFPADWTETKRAKTSDDALDGAAAKIPSCKPFVAFSKANRKYRRAQSPNFDLASSTVTNSVSVFPSAPKAAAVITTFTDSRMPACLEKLFDASYKAQLKRDPKTAKKVTSVKTSISTVPDVRIGDQSIAYQGTVDIGLTDGTTQTVGLGFAATRVGKALAGYSWTSDADISAALQPAIVKSAARLQSVQSS